MPKKWVIKEQEIPIKELIDAAGSELLAKLLVQRGVNTPAKIETFFNPLSIVPISPYSFSDMEKAVKRIKDAIDNQQHILIYGDFDADGVTSTALLHKTFTKLGAKFSYYIPDREKESHGLRSDVLLRKISKEAVKLVVTVDCAVNDKEEISLAKSFGVDVIVTDHHEAKDVLPPAYAIINPKAPKALKEDLGMEDIISLASMAGVGVAFKLACALLDDCGMISYIEDLLPLVAVGTVADLMPLLYENRLFVALGLKLIQEGKNLGLNELLRVAEVNITEPLSSEKIAFSIAPRINAAGRLDSAEKAFKLLTSNNQAEVVLLAQMLNNFNKVRQELADKVFDEALDYIEKNSNEDESIVLAYKSDWHVGIIGIVASRLTEYFNRPAFVFTDSPDGSAYRASVRSVEGINIFEVLDMNTDYMTSCGGHSMAAGLAIDKSLTDLDTFKSAINKTVLEITGGEIFQPELKIDMEVSAKDLTLNLIEDLKKLEPCGVGNEQPIFAIRDLKLQSEKVMGSSGNHLKFSCVDKAQNTVDCVYWKHSTLNLNQGSKLDIAFSPKINEFNGIKSLRLDIKDYNSDFILSAETLGVKVIDHRKKLNILPQVVDYVKKSIDSYKIFAEDKSILNELSEFSSISECIINRLNLKQAEQLLFIDYPADEKLLKTIIKTVKPKIIHFMNYKLPQTDIDNLIVKLSGMLKYAANKYGGVVFIPELSASLSISDDLAMLIVKLLNRTNVIKVNEFKQGKIYFDFLTSVSSEIIKNHEVYEQCRIELFKSRKYRENLIIAEDIRMIATLK